MKMKSLIWIIILAFSGLVAKELALGSAIPSFDIKMIDVSGKKVGLSSINNENGLLVVFSSNTCPWVLAWEDRYHVIAEACKQKKIGFITLNSNEAQREGVDSLEEMQAHAKEKGYKFLYAVDKNSKLANAFGATRTPHVYLFDKEGKLVYRGAIDDNARKPQKVKKHYLMDALEAVAAGETVSIASTKALGCSIKFSEK